MTAREIIKMIMEKQNHTNASFATQLGIEPPTLWDRLNNKKTKDLSFDSAITMLRALGYKIQIVPVTKSTPNKPNPKDVGNYEVK